MRAGSVCTLTTLCSAPAPALRTNFLLKQLNINDDIPIPVLHLCQSNLQLTLTRFETPQRYVKMRCFKLRPVEPVEQDELSPLSVVLHHSPQPSLPFYSSHLTYKLDHHKVGRIMLGECSKVSWASVTRNIKHHTTSSPM